MHLLEPTHLLLIGIVVLLLFGPKKIPEMMRGIGKGMGELQKGIADGKTALSNAMQEIQHEPVVDPTTPVVTETPVQPEPTAEPAAAVVAEGPAKAKPRVRSAAKSVSKKDQVPQPDAAKSA